jgi:hypothetical protein
MTTLLLLIIGYFIGVLTTIVFEIMENEREKRIKAKIKENIHYEKIL